MAGHNGPLASHGGFLVALGGSRRVKAALGESRRVMAAQGGSRRVKVV